ncbi:MAG: endonuclease/exonuclease/phosphatase family protein [Hyphomicrobiaceae bacterium]
MRIATFNLESLDLPPRANRSIEERIGMLAPELQRARADVLCLQEVNGQSDPGHHRRTLLALDRLLEGTPYAHYHRAVSEMNMGSGIADVHNLVTLSRWPITSARSLRNVLVGPLTYRPVTAGLSAEVDETVVFDRPLLATEIDIGEQPPLTVINCHLRAPLASSIPGQKLAPFIWRTVGGWAEGFCLSSIKRNAQALELRLAIDELLSVDPQAFIVVAGDFNAEDHESPVRIVSGAEQDTGNGALAVQSMIVLDRAVEEGRRFSVIHQGRPQMLDHILVSRAMYGRFGSIEVHNEALSDEAVGFARVDRPTGSYHACVVAEFA